LQILLGNYGRIGVISFFQKSSLAHVMASRALAQDHGDSDLPHCCLHELVYELEMPVVASSPFSQNLLGKFGNYC